MSPMEPVQSKSSTWMGTWANAAWWIVTIFSVPFGLYTLPFIYGEFEIYKHLTREAGLGNHHLAGLHILHNLRTWQIHAAAALLFVIIGPFQFNAAFRNNHPVLHKRLGYMFVVCTVITAVTGATTMRKASELTNVTKALAPFMSTGTLVALVISITAARNKKFQTHRQWIMRSAAIGYSVMYTRFLPPLINVILKNEELAFSSSMVISLLLNCGFAEIYIQMYLIKSNRKGTITKVS